MDEKKANEHHKRLKKWHESQKQQWQEDKENEIFELHIKMFNRLLDFAMGKIHGEPEHLFTAGAERQIAYYIEEMREGKKKLLDELDRISSHVNIREELQEIIAKAREKE